MKTISIQTDHKLISFDVKSLFTNVPLHFTTDLILKGIFEGKKMQKNIRKKEMKEGILLCRENVHFSFSDIIYRQCDRVAMGSLLGSVFAGIIMVHLEHTLIPKLIEYMNLSKRYVDYTILIIKETSVTHVITVINNFHKNTVFTYEMVENRKIAAFLDVLIVRNNNTLKITI